MVQAFFLGLLALVLLAVWTAGWLAKAPPAQIARLLRRLAVATGAVVLVLLLVRGGPGALLLLIPLLLPLLLRRRLKRQSYQRSAGSPRGGQHSEVETRFLRMRLDHDSGEVHGEIIEGMHKGRDLAELRLAELVELWLDYCDRDGQSASVLEAYLDRTHGEAWREAAEQAQASGLGQGPASTGGPMSREEAYEILGLEAGASAEEIRVAHRRLMQKVHPDQGGSTYLASKINQAKDVLLGN